MAIYMRYGVILGAVTTAGFEHWIELISFQIGTRRDIDSAAHKIQSREADEPRFNEVTVSKRMDVSSPDLFIESVAGDLDSTVTITFTTTSNNQVRAFLSYRLENVAISSYVSSSNGEIPIETLTLNYAKIKKSFIGLNPELKGNTETVGYDLTLMKTM